MNNNNKKILIIEDEEKIVEVLLGYLKKSGFETQYTYDGIDALEKFKQFAPDIVLLDLMLPNVTGEEICKQIRKISRVPIIMLTAKTLEDDKITGLEIGADDYITKPFSPRELLARINSILRRADAEQVPLFEIISYNDSDLEVNLTSHTVKKKGESINLTPNEFKILATLIKFSNKIFTREELIKIAFGLEFEGFDRTIDSHIKNLRSKIEDDTTKPCYIKTIRGVGYKFGENI